jgi:hypothetical protein
MDISRLFVVCVRASIASMERCQARRSRGRACGLSQLGNGAAGASIKSLF